MFIKQFHMRLFSTLIYNLYIFTRKSNPRISEFGRKLYNKFYNTNEIVTICNKQLIYCDYTHKLAEYQKNFPKYDRQLAQICNLLKQKKQDNLNIIDVGANIGDTVINIGQKDAFYLLIEGNKTFYNYIEKNLRKYHYNVEYTFLSDEEDRVTPVSHDGTAKLTKTNATCGTISCKLDEILTSKYSKLKFDLLKIDTDGFDFKVLRGATRLLEEQTPLIFFEWDKMFLHEQDEDEISIFRYLENKGYNHLILFDNFGNYFATSNTADITLLKTYIEGTRIDGKPFYYDVLAIPANSPVTIEGIREILL